MSEVATAGVRLAFEATRKLGRAPAMAAHPAARFGVTDVSAVVAAQRAAPVVSATVMRKVPPAPTLRHVIALGGTVAAEHGVGKIKRKWVALQLSPLQIGAMRALKRELDP